MLGQCTRFTLRNPYVISAGSNQTLPATYTGMNQFAQAIGRQPNVVSYYNHWLQPFKVGFVTSAAKHGAVTLVKIDPEEYFTGKHCYRPIRQPTCRSYATAVKAFGAQVVLSFGHEMNGDWYSLGIQAYVPCGIRGRMAAYRHRVP